MIKKFFRFCVILLVFVFASVLVSCSSNKIEVEEDELPFIKSREADTAYINGNYSLSVELITESILFDENMEAPILGLFYFYRSKFYLALDDYENAEKDINEASRLSLYDEYNKIIRLIIYYNENDYKINSDLEQKLDNINSEFRFIAFNKGYFYLRIGKFEAAKKEILRSIKHESQEGKIFFAKYILSYISYRNSEHVETLNILSELEGQLGNLEQMWYLKESLKDIEVFFDEEPFNDISYLHDIDLSFEDNFRLKFTNVIKELRINVNSL